MSDSRDKRPVLSMGRPPGTVVTFYSYKGGVGRSFLLANAAALLSRWGWRVLCIDWDLDAPGLHQYLRPLLRESEPTAWQEKNGRPRFVAPGLIDLVRDVELGNDPRWRDLVLHASALATRSPGAAVEGTLDFLPAGAADLPEYGQKVAGLDWRGLFSRHQFGAWLERARSDWTQEYDLVLVDSRTGITDAGGVSTVQLPDILVFAFTANVQSLYGAADTARSIGAQHASLGLDRRILRCVPVASRFDARSEVALAGVWADRFLLETREFVAPWAVDPASHAKLLQLLRLGHFARWTFGEELPVVHEQIGSPENVSYTIANLAALLARGLSQADDFVAGRDAYVEGARARPSESGSRSARRFEHDVVLSHVSDDREYATAFADELRRRGLRVLDPKSSGAIGESVFESIGRAIAASEHMLLLASGGGSRWQRTEVSAFLSLTESDPARRLIAVRRGDAPASFPYGIDSTNVIDGTTLSPAQLADRVTQALRPTLTEVALGTAADVGIDVGVVPDPHPSIRKVFIAYTAEDLSAYADVVVRVVADMDWVSIDHRRWAANGRPSVEECLKHVRESDVVVLLVAHRRGWVPTAAQGGDGKKSITWIEWDAARKANKTVLPFVVDDAASWPPKFMEEHTDPAVGPFLREFKAAIGETNRGTFSKPEDLERSVVRALHKVEMERSLRAIGRAPGVTSVDPIAAYRRHVAASHHRLVPFAPEVSDILLRDAAVELEVDPERAFHPRDETIGKSGGRATLRKLITDSIAGVAKAPMPRWLVIGDPGAGKTTIARNLARQLADDVAAPVPIFASVARLADRGGDIATLAASDMATDAELLTGVRQALVERLGQRGAVWILLDGFDEVPEGLRAKAWTAVEELATSCPSAVVVVLSRPIAFERKLVWATFHTARVAALDETRQRELATRLVGESIAGAIMAATMALPRISEFARNPLLLTLLAFVARDAMAEGREIPSDGGRLFGAAIRLLLGRGFSLEPRAVKDQTAARELLQALSLSLHRRGGETWWPDELSNVLWGVRQGSEEDVPDSSTLNFRLKETWETNDAFLHDVAFNAGVISSHDGPAERWRYLHRALREFLAAERLVALPKGRGDVLFDEWRRSAKTKSGPEVAHWAEVFQLYLSLASAPPERFAQLAQVSAGLGLRALRGAEHIAGDERLKLVLDADSADSADGADTADGSDLLLAARSHPDPDAAASLLMARVEPGLSLDRVGRVHWVLEAIGRPAKREAFFAACGRPLVQVPSLEFKMIPAGRFRMGSPEKPKAEIGRFDGEGPAHDVIVPAFELATTPVTEAQYRAFAATVGAPPVDGWSARRGKSEVGERLPVTDVSWWAARLYCAWLGARLPSEAEWEYACRAGTPTRFWSGDQDADLARVGWYDKNSGGHIHAVGELPANPWGLVDMHGNVWEWCEDTWHENYQGAPVDGRAWVGEGPGGRVVRGGSFGFPAVGARSAYRGRVAPGARYVALGLRPARPVTSV